jgi:hypothetical protein
MTSLPLQLFYLCSRFLYLRFFGYVAADVAAEVAADVAADFAVDFAVDFCS